MTADTVKMMAAMIASGYASVSMPEHEVVEKSCNLAHSINMYVDAMIEPMIGETPTQAPASREPESVAQNWGRDDKWDGIGQQQTAHSIPLGAQSHEAPPAGKPAAEAQSDPGAIEGKGRTRSASRGGKQGDGSLLS